MTEFHNWLLQVNSGRCKPDCPECAQRSIVANMAGHNLMDAGAEIERAVRGAKSSGADRLPALMDIHMTDAEKEATIEDGARRRLDQLGRERCEREHEWGKHQRMRDPDCAGCQVVLNDDRRNSARLLTEAFAQIWSAAQVPRGFRHSQSPRSIYSSSHGKR